MSLALSLTEFYEMDGHASSAPRDDDKGKYKSLKKLVEAFVPRDRHDNFDSHKIFSFMRRLLGKLSRYIHANNYDYSDFCLVLDNCSIHDAEKYEDFWNNCPLLYTFLPT